MSIFYWQSISLKLTEKDLETSSIVYEKGDWITSLEDLNSLSGGKPQ